MRRNSNRQVEIQKDYYARTASRYDEMHVHQKDEHYLSATLLLATLDFFEIRSILDIGAGTGRVVKLINKKRPDVRIVGIEPVAELREQGYISGLSSQVLLEGNALALAFKDSEFDLVCEFGVLHHIQKPEIAVSEMLRVAKKAIFISDSNNFGQGRLPVRKLKQFINYLGLWKFFDLIKTKGKGYSISEGDGLAYSYSVFNNYKQIEKQCKNIHLFNTVGSGVNLYKCASHVALLGIKN